MNNPVVLRSDRVVYYDVDDTLIMYDYPYEKIEETLLIGPLGYEIRVWPHKQHIERLKQFKARSQKVVVWSQGGWEWAENVVVSLGLSDYVDIIMSKPSWIFDDMPVSAWLGEQQRSYVDPISGEAVRASIAEITYNKGENK